jgi:uncharacterized repeat protein (TIGR02543 family)
MAPAARWFVLAVLVVGVAACGKIVETSPDASGGDDDDDVPTIDAADEVSVTVTLAGNGSGRVTSDPTGIDCGGTCEASFPAGTPITLSAAPTDANSTFTGWTGGSCTGTGSCVVTPTDSVTVTATFTAISCTGGSQTFSFTGTTQTLTRPACVTSITIDAFGASGGAAFDSGAGAIGGGGLGGHTIATIAISSSDVIFVEVGGAGGVGASSVPGAGGYNGGAPSGTESSSQAGGGGGGASDVRRNGTALTDRVVVAAGGGGGCSCSSQGSFGGAGGGLAGGGPTVNCGGGTAPTGGTQTAGGTASDYPGWCATTAGVFGSASGGCSPSGGGGGGGGYYGGAGGAWWGGAGGSSYADPGAAGVTLDPGIQAGNGQVTISW